MKNRTPFLLLVFTLLLLLAGTGHGTCLDQGIPTSPSNDASCDTSPDTIPIWPKIYGGNIHTQGDDVDVMYDKGYLLTGNVLLSTGYPKSGILMKTDINGEILWEKRVGDSPYYIATCSSCGTTDGGFINIGWTTELDPYADACILKFDACANIQWCKIYSVPDDPDYGVSIVQLADEGYLAQINYFGYDGTYQRVWLFRLNSSGELIWQKVYDFGHPELAHSWGEGLMVSTDDSFIVSGTTAVESPVGSGLWWGEPLLIKADPDGEEVFVRAFQYDRDIYYGLGSKAKEDPYGNFYVTSKNYYDPVQNNSPGAIVQFDSNGTGVRWMNLWAPMYQGGTCSTVDFISTDSMFVAGGYAVATFDTAYAMVYIMDTSGQVLNEALLKMDPDGNVVRQTVLTPDRKALMIASFYSGPVQGIDMYLYKMSYDLEFAPFDPRILTYDSLCPNLPIASDTIVPDCDIIVGLEGAFTNPSKSRLKIFPNPADQQVTIALPELWISEFQASGVTSKTAWYTYPDQLTMQVFNADSKQVYSLPIPDPHTPVTIDIGRWGLGIYFVMITARDKVLLTDKFIVN